MRKVFMPWPWILFYFPPKWQTYFSLHFCCYCSVSQLRLTSLWPVGCSTPGSPVLHHLLELAHTHVHRVGGAIIQERLLCSYSASETASSRHQPWSCSPWAPPCPYLCPDGSIQQEVSCLKSLSSLDFCDTTLGFPSTTLVMMFQTQFLVSLTPFPCSSSSFRHPQTSQMSHVWYRSIDMDTIHCPLP